MHGAPRIICEQTAMSKRAETLAAVPVTGFGQDRGESLQLLAPCQAMYTDFGYGYVLLWLSLQWQATTPTFQVGSKVPIKMKTASVPPKAAWTLDPSINTDDLIDEDELLTEEDRTVRPGKIFLCSLC